MSSRIRGKEATLRVAVEGQDQEGLMKVRNWSVTPDSEIVTTQFCGQPRKEADQDFHGYKLSFEVEELDRTAENIIQQCDEAQKNQLPPPRAIISTLKIYREPGKGTISHVYHPVTLNCTQSTDANGSSYISSKWEGFAPERETIA